MDMSESRHRHGKVFPIKTRSVRLDTSKTEISTARGMVLDEDEVSAAMSAQEGPSTDLEPSLLALRRLGQREMQQCSGDQRRRRLLHQRDLESACRSKQAHRTASHDVAVMGWPDVDTAACVGRVGEGQTTASPIKLQ